MSERSVRTIREHVIAVAAEARAEATDRERRNISPEPLVRSLIEAGIGALRVPIEFGGADGSVTDLAELLVEVAAADSNLTQIVRGHLGFVEFLRLQAPGEGREELLSAAGRGELFGPAASVKAPAQPTPGATSLVDGDTRLTTSGQALRVSGTKYYTTGSLYADWINVLVPVEQGYAEAVVRADDPGVTVTDDWNGFGQRHTASGTTVFDNVPVSPGHVFARTDADVDAYLNAFYQFVHSATQAGIARRAGEDLAEIVRHRTRTYPLAPSPQPQNDPQVLATVGEVIARGYTARANVAALAATIDRYAAGATNLTDIVIESATVQVINSRLVGEATWLLFDAASASAVDADLALDRHWRNARTISSHNPSIYKARIIGDHAVNQKLPRSPFSRTE
ncbi:acyl-CoA dehydrogenase family protein [Nocardia alni]|uniref:acyl-CoA dehydrogenase family protein n=1 Tax=Nocardia alni TaxID=2815723 RepID=UPI001C246F31|nr:acyl-CoA dehydrogenase family protein [Nocardia alni]